MRRLAVPARGKHLQPVPTTSQMNHEKILIVEDEENERSGLAELVSSWGYRAETARDGAEGLEKATQWGPVDRRHRSENAAHGRH